MKATLHALRMPLLMPFAVLLLSSAVIRVGLEAGVAFAASRPALGRAEEALVCAPTPADIAKSLDVREKAIAAEEATLKAKKMKLDQTEIKINLKMKELQAEQDRLNRIVAYADEAAEKDLAKLTDIYQAMKPKDASALFDSMEPDFAAGFLGRMRPTEAAAILAAMEPTRAYALSATLAGRNAEAKK